MYFAHRKMTQQELATAVGCSRQTIVLLEQGRYSPLTRYLSLCACEACDWLAFRGECESRFAGRVTGSAETPFREMPVAVPVG